MTEPNEQLKEEIQNKVLPALQTVLREPSTNTTRTSILRFFSARKPREVFHVDCDDKKRFLKAISIEGIECIHHTILEGPQLDERNETTRDHQFPGHPTCHGGREQRVGGRGHGTVNHPLANVGGDASFSYNTQDHYREDPCPVPAHARRTRRRNTAHFTHRLHLVVQANYSIRVYSHTPVRTGAGIGGGAGAVLGAAGGTAGGAAAGALIGSIVPIAGTIVGGVIGAIAGGVGGTLAGGGVGAGVGAGGGAIHSNSVYETVCAYKVFQKLSNFSYDKNNNSCRCTIIVNTVCPADYQNLERI